MKCFYHPDLDAVALCKSCNRGICSHCGADVPPGVACRGKCEEDVASLNLVIRRSKTAYEKTGTAYRRNAIVMLIMGLSFIALGGLTVLMSKNYGALFLVPMGCLFLLWSYFSYRSGKQITEVPDRDEPRTIPNGEPAASVESSNAPGGPPSVN